MTLDGFTKTGEKVLFLMYRTQIIWAGVSKAEILASAQLQAIPVWAQSK